MDQFTPFFILAGITFVMIASVFIYDWTDWMIANKPVYTAFSIIYTLCFLFVCACALGYIKL